MKLADGRFRIKWSDF